MLLRKERTRPPYLLRAGWARDSDGGQYAWSLFLTLTSCRGAIEAARGKPAAWLSKPYVGISAQSCPNFDCGVTTSTEGRMNPELSITLETSVQTWHKATGWLLCHALKTCHKFWCALCYMPHLYTFPIGAPWAQSHCSFVRWTFVCWTVVHLTLARWER